jgi:hypothetical protein
VVSPDGVQAEHWFEVETVDGGTRLRHTIDGEASGDFAYIWREAIEPAHNVILEALLDHVQEALV